MATFVAQRMYVAPIAAIGTIANVAGTASMAKDMLGGTKGFEESQKYNPQNTALAQTKPAVTPPQPQQNQFSVGSVVKGGIGIAKGLGKGAFDFAKNNKKFLAGSAALTAGMTAGMNKLSNSMSQPSSGEKSSAGKIATTAAGVGAAAGAYGYMKNKSNISKAAKRVDDLKKLSSDGIKSKWLEGEIKSASDNLTKLKSAPKAGLRKAGKYGLIAAGITAAGMAAKNALSSKPEEKTYTGFGRVFKVAGKYAKNSLAAAKGGNWGQAASNLGKSASTVGNKIVNTTTDLVTFGKANSAIKSTTNALKAQGGAAEKVGNFLDKHKTASKAIVGGGLAYGAMRTADNIGEKIGNKIVKPNEDNQQ